MGSGEPHAGELDESFRIPPSERSKHRRETCKLRRSQHLRFEGSVGWGEEAGERRKI